MAQPSFSAEVKNDLARSLGRKACCRTAELAALLRMGAVLTLGAKRSVGLAFATENAAVARKALMLLKGSAGVRTELTVIRSRRLKKNNSYRVRVLPSREAAALMERLGLMRGSAFNMGTDSALLEKTCCRRAYLRGAFLGGGSVSRPEAGYHLELVTESYSFAGLLLSLLRTMGYPAGLTDRKESYVVYLKESDAIIDFLSLLGAEKAAEAFEVTRNLKEVKNQVNRLVNCETANVQKSVDAAGRQIAAIRALEAADAVAELSAGLREMAAVRLEHPTATLAELAGLLGIGKSGVNHRLRKLVALADGQEGEI